MDGKTQQINCSPKSLEEAKELVKSSAWREAVEKACKELKEMRKQKEAESRIDRMSIRMPVGI